MKKILNHPLDSHSILRKKRAIKRTLLENAELVSKRIAILGGSTSSSIKDFLELFLLDSGISPVFYESEYNKYYEDAIFGNAELDAFKPDVIYIHVSSVNITQFPIYSMTEEDVQRLVDDEVSKFKNIWESLYKFDCAIVQNNFDYLPQRSLGNLDGYSIHGKTNFVNMLNSELAKNARYSDKLYLNDINYLSASVGLDNWFDQSLWQQGKYAVSMEGATRLAKNLSNILTSIFGLSKKCLVLDLDNTCWGGVIGDDGVDNIEIGVETSLAEGYTSFQKYVRELHQRGILLAVCSKNDEENAIAGFNRLDSILKYEDFTVVKANWDPKNKNIVDIAYEINIGLDSLVFIDDNPVERELVLSSVFGVSVPDVGADVIDFINHIDKNGYFEPISMSTDDIKRSQFYKDNEVRAIHQIDFKSYDDFLISLEMSSFISSFSSLYMKRVTQLVNKTNQFNLTTKRYTSSEIESISEDDNYIKLYGILSDKFGDNGLVSVVIGRIEGRQCHIDLWVMSCRVLKRNFEHAMLDELVLQCKRMGVSEIMGYYYKSKKNSMVYTLYEEFGFSLFNQNGDNSLWKIDVSGYINKNKFIEVNNAV